MNLRDGDDVGTLIFVAGRREIDRSTGALIAAQLDEWISRHLRVPSGGAG